MSSILFQLSGNLIDGRYLPGEYQWPYAVTLQQAAVGCEDYPASGQLTLALEVGGVLTANAFIITAAGAAPAVLALGLVVPANTPVRWKAAFTGAPSDAADGVAVVVTTGFGSLIPPPELVVVYASSPSSSLTLFNAVNGANGTVFTEASPGISAGVSVVQNADQISFYLMGTEALRIQGGVCYANDFDAEGVQTTDYPRLQFLTGNAPVASLSAAALHVVNVVEGAPPGAGGFQFFNNGTLAAVLTTGGLTALQVQEGIP